MNTNQLLTVSIIGLAVNLVGMFATGHHHHGHSVSPNDTSSRNPTRYALTHCDFFSMDMTTRDTTTAMAIHMVRTLRVSGLTVYFEANLGFQVIRTTCTECSW